MKPLHLFLFIVTLLASFPINTHAQKKKPLIDMPLPEQLARVANEHAPFESVIMHEGDTVIFSHRFRVPGKTAVQIYDITREALLEVLGPIQSSHIIANGRDRIMVRTSSVVHGVHPTLKSHSDVELIINAVIRGDTLYTTARLFNFSVTVQGWDGHGSPKTNTDHYRLGHFYPINQQKADDDPLASWNSISIHYSDVYKKIRAIEMSILLSDQFIPE